MKEKIINFADLFQVDFGGKLTAKKKMKVNGAFINKGDIIPEGHLIGGINFWEHQGQDMATTKEGDILVIRAFFR